MTTFISDQAAVDPRAEIDEDVEIGPFCIVGSGAKIGRGTHLVGNVTIDRGCGPASQRPG